MITMQQKEEGFMIILVILSISAVFIGIFQNNMTLVFAGVAIILLDTVLLLDYNHRYKKESKNEIH